jgi:hypothetical protein
VTDIRIGTGYCLLNSGGTFTVKNSAGTVVDSGATCVISGGLFASLNLVSTKAVVDSGVKITTGITGTYTNGITPTVVNGVITGFVLS